MDPLPSTLATPSPSTSSLIPPALQHSPSPPPVQRHSGTAAAAQRGKPSPMRKTSGTRLAGTGIDATSVSPPGLRTALDRKEEVKRLAQRLATRLQYAAFKVERGWTRHTLPEVENLYWRATKVDNATTATSPSGLHRKKHERGGVYAHTPSSRSSRSAQDTRGAKRPRADEVPVNVVVDGLSGSTSEVTAVEEDVFGSSLPITRPPPGPGATAKHHAQTAVIGLNGLPTPPPSAGTDIAPPGSTSSSKDRLADLRVSPTRQMQAARAVASATGRGVGAAAAAAGAEGSYADFWSKLGSSPVRGVKRVREGVEAGEDPR